ncbi:MAG: hypothetical protein M3264_14615 [Thermoproteota archaeon]|nr:hypothetical protein [Thermoproteota archaeon]
MIKGTFTFSTVAIVVVLLPIAGIGGTTFITTTLAQMGGPEEITFRTDLGEPFFKENGKITGQKEIGPNRTHFSYSADGALKGDIQVTDRGDLVSISKGNDLTFAQGQGIITTTDGNDMANYTIIGVGNVTEEGKPVIQGAAAYSTNSTGKLAFLNNVLGIFKAELDEKGGFVSNEWEWK